MKRTSPSASIKVKSFLISIVILAISSVCFGQSHNDSLLKIWKDFKQPNHLRAKAYNQFISKNYLENQTDSAYILVQQLKQFTLDHHLKREYANVLITLAQVQEHINNSEEAAINYQESLILFRKLNDKKGEAIALSNIGRMYKLDWQLDEALNYYNESLKISKELQDTTQIIVNSINIGNVYAIRYKTDEALEYFLKSLELSVAINDKKNEVLALICIGHNYTMLKDYDTAFVYFNKSLAISESINNFFLQATSLKNISQSYFAQKNYDKLIEYSKKGLVLAEKISNNALQNNLCYFLYEGYKGKKNFKMAIEYMEKSNKLEAAKQEVKTEKQLLNIRISKIKMTDSLMQLQNTFETSLKHDLAIKQKNDEKSNLTLGFGTGFIAILAIGFFGYKNVKRKQLIIAQEKEIESQKKDKLLKNLELQAIDAMILGQEKERQRLALDLHDSVGASLSAAKLQFNYLINEKKKPKQTEELITKISALLEDAYLEVRSMSHLENSGVMAKNGLLPAVINLSENVSTNNGLQIEVHSHGLDQRLENSLEISIFRIIQELVTNVIKHAEATEAAIHITNHEHSLNIMVEDNGKGFNLNEVAKSNKGMGISNIEKRVEHLNGTMTIESDINKGSTFIIDIPL